MSKTRLFQVKESVKLRQIMQTILTLGNALNQGTARGSTVGFKLDSLLKLSDTHARNNKMTLMHYLCKLLAEKMPELLDFYKDLTHQEAASKIQLKTLAEEMQAVSKGLEKVEQELTASDNDGYISMGFQNVRKNEDSSLIKELIPFIFVTDLSISIFQMNSWGILLGNIACCFPSYLLARLLWHTE